MSMAVASAAGFCDIIESEEILVLALRICADVLETE